MTSSRTRVVFWLAIASLVVAFLIALIPGLASAPRGVTLSLGFSGYSTNVSGAVLAQFTVSNSNPWAITHRIGEPQVKSNGSWPQAYITEGPTYEMLPGQTSNFVIGLPSASGVWRVPVIYGRPRNILECRFLWAVGKVAPLVGRDPPSSASPIETNFTPEIAR